MERFIKWSAVIVVTLALILCGLYWSQMTKVRQDIMSKSDEDYILMVLRQKSADDCVLTPISENVWACGDEYCFWNKFQNKYLYRRVPPNIRQHNMSDAEFSTQVLRIPKLIDWQNPERGLWGMIDWTKLDGYITHKGDIYFQDGESDDTDPFTALLKTLCEQEGI